MSEEKIKAKLIDRGFSKETLLNNRGLIGATIEETKNQQTMSEEKALIIIPMLVIEYKGFTITKVHFGWLRKVYYYTTKTNKR